MQNARITRKYRVRKTGEIYRAIAGSSCNGREGRGRERGREGEGGREREKVGFWDGQAGFSSGGTIRCRINQRNTPSIELASRWFTIERDRRTLNSESNEKKKGERKFYNFPFPCEKRVRRTALGIRRTLLLLLILLLFIPIVDNK